ncbi:YdcF family protein [Stigmatella erecta]|uniref:Uncharacterized SAM-binding protein YcdF, DUF218 family n=1 Tax=Stigmatella erecta TaxID=83460 RepID=A0A1I0KIZ6_9BACT|nr:YdcF family protein [Stigmatella erecta]SEU24881.1 Uncharacterized SAM-binding protein YcdF, DUF218 family [Stigmatella erecta]
MRPSSLRARAGALRRLLLVLGGALTCGGFGLAWYVGRFGRREGAVPAEVGVVLGARVLAGGVPSGALWARVEKAVALYQQGLVPRLLFSGGTGLHPPSEAQVMRALAVRLGVPAEACLLEEQSHSTEQNARFSAEVLRRLGAQRVVVISDAYHLLRARQYFRLQGLEVATSPAPSGERLEAVEHFYWTVREAFALLAHPRVLLARSPLR